MRTLSGILFLIITTMFCARVWAQLIVNKDFGSGEVPDRTRRYDKLKDKMEKEEGFINPQKEYRPVPMWAWSGDIEDAEIDRQLELMVKQNIYEPMIYPRYGLITPYLSEEWFARVKHTVERAEELRMKVWLYDEFCWPSGTAKGMVIKDNPLFRMVSLKCLRYSVSAESKKRDVSFEVSGEQVQANAFSPTSGEIIELSGCIQRGKLEWQAPPGNWEIAVFVVSPPQDYVDTMNPTAIASFISYTHKNYYKVLQPELIKEVKGIFTDEPVFAHGRSGSNFPWTAKLPERFIELKRYDLIPKLYELVFDVGDFIKLRHDFWEVATIMYAESYHRQIGEWCEEHGIDYTGHLLAEQPLSALLRHEGDFFLNEREFQIPGMDEISTNPTLRSGSQFIAAKMTQSTADYIGANRTFCEVYALGPCSMTLNKMKRMVNFASVLGINTYLLAVCPYSMEGNATKSGYFSTLFYQQPWFSYFHLYSDYVGRVTYMLTRGSHVVNVGVMFPTESYWIRNTFDMDSSQYWSSVEKGHEQISRTLLFAHIDYDYIFDQCFEETVIENGKISIGNQTYPIVILPPVKFLSGDILRKLQKFVETGGKLIAYGLLPESDLEGKDISVTISSIFGVNPVEHNNNMLNTIMEENRWVSAASDEPHWLVVDFGEEKTFDEIKLFFSMNLEGTARLSLADYKLQYDRNGQWVDMVSLKDNTEFEPTYSFPAVSSRKVRLFVTNPGPGGKVARLREIQVFEYSEDKPNIALASAGATATCDSTYYDNSTADKAIDGDKRLRKPLSESVEVHNNTYGHGEAIFLSKMPQYVSSQALKKVWEEIIEVRDVIIKSSEGKNILYQHRRTPEQEIYFFINMMREKIDDAAISIKAYGIPKIWNPDDGNITDIGYSLDDDRIEFRLSLEAGQGVFVVVDKNKNPKSDETVSPKATSEPIFVLDGIWDFETDRANSFRVKDWQPTTDGSLEAKVNIDFVPDNASIYYQENFVSFISVNGKPLDGTAVKSYYMDESYLETEAVQLLKRGENIIKIKSPLAKESKYLPLVFILGDFSVKENRICSPMDKIDIGDWTSQGYPEYAGTGIYKKRFELTEAQINSTKLYVSLDVGKNVVEVWLNGYYVGTRAWEPYRIEITDYIRFGKNEIEIKVTNSLYNRILDETMSIGLFRASIESVQTD